PPEQQILAKQADAGRGTIGLGDIARQAGNDPVTAEHIPHRRARTDLAEQLVLFTTQHRSPPSDRSLCVGCLWRARAANATGTTYHSFTRPLLPARPRAKVVTSVVYSCTHGKTERTKANQGSI